MRVISPYLQEIKEIIGYQEFKIEAVCTQTPYLVQSNLDDYIFWYNLLTREIICFDHNDLNNVDVQKYMVEHWFLINENTSIDMVARCAFKIHKLQFSHKPVDKLCSFTILSTTNCNAKCAYCYQQGTQHKTMSHDTALDVAKFIESHGADYIRIKWFGGEPLCNIDAINTISQYLYDHHIFYKSDMTTNGFLIGNISSKRLKSLWHLSKVQITLDGDKDVYNTVKSYLTDKDRAFDIVIDNIAYLASEQIKVSIRLNLSFDNYDSLHNLIDILADKFTGNEYIKVYSTPLYEGAGNSSHIFSSEESKKIFDQQISLLNYIRQKRLTKPMSIPKFQVHSCMADSDTSVVILPDGSLSKCEHDLDSRIIGSIYNDNYDTDLIRAWKEYKSTYNKCATCFYFPQCHVLKMCPTRIGCNDEYREYIKYKGTLIIEDAYRRYKKKVVKNS